MWHGNFMGKEFNSVNNSQRPSGRDIYLVTTVMVQSWTNIPTLQSVRGPTSSLSWFLMQHDTSSGGCQGRAIKVEVPFNMLIGTEMWMNAQISKEI